ncbi:MAG: DNRLRE domain-containing protein [Verrucomicrobia bacterium]|nr:DNRLRE domain-containing protein [Verrucomicrobiota bacterium]
MSPLTFLRTSLIAAITLTLPCSAQILSCGFEASEGYSPGNLGASGPWSIALNNGAGTGISSVTVVTATANTGTQSLLIQDNNTANRPVVTCDLGESCSSGILRLAIRRATSSATAWYLNFYNASNAKVFGLICDGASTISLTGGAAGTTTLATYTNASLLSTLSSWANLEIRFNEATHGASVLLNGTTVLSAYSVATNWSVRKFDLSAGYGSGTNLGIYLDSLSVTPLPPLNGSWLLTFSDEFKSPNTYLDGSKWKVGEASLWINGQGGNDPGNISQAAGVLNLRSQVRNYTFGGTNYAYTGAELSTFGLFRQQYGYFEVRARFPFITGLWPAFWLMPDRGAYGNLSGYYRSLLKFDLNGANISQVNSAYLKLTVSSADQGSGNNLLVLKVRDDSWTETGVTWNNQPVQDPAWIAQAYNQTYASGQQLTFDVKDFVTEKLAGNRQVSILLADTFRRVRQIKFYSKEWPSASVRPQLVVNGVTYYPVADSSLQNGTAANTNFGSTTELVVRDDWGDTSSTYNGGMEVDIWESLSFEGQNSAYQTLHWDGYGVDHQSAGTGLQNFTPTMDGYHTYGVYWESGLMEFYVDGVKTYTFANSRACSVPCYILLSLQLGGWDPANAPGSQVDNQLTQVDWVRVWSGTKQP